MLSEPHFTVLIVSIKYLVISVIQRVKQAEVSINGCCVGRISQGLMALVAVEKDDAEQQAERLAERLLSYRVFADRDDKMNLSVRDIKGGVLLISQFTLAANTRSGTRPSFSPAAAPKEARRLFDLFVESVQLIHEPVACGQFGADMQVSLVNDGPVTFIIRV